MEGKGSLPPPPTIPAAGSCCSRSSRPSGSGPTPVESVPGAKRAYLIVMVGEAWPWCSPETRPWPLLAREQCHERPFFAACINSKIQEGFLAAGFLDFLIHRPRPASTSFWKALSALAAARWRCLLDGPHAAETSPTQVGVGPLGACGNTRTTG